VPSPTATISFETPRFLVGTDEKVDLAFEDAKWNDNIPSLLRTAVIESFENAGYQNVGTDMQGFAGGRQLLLDIRSFRITPGAAPVADVAYSAKVLGDGGVFVAGRLFHATAPVEGDFTAAASAAALNAAFRQTAQDLLPWVTAQM
jgi:phospholipid/cholesterol/gamma-HCH transport system substrate-binding protein